MERKMKGVKLNEPSVESPYTSLGSDGSYNPLLSTSGINCTNGVGITSGLNFTNRMNITSGMNNVTYSGYTRTRTARTGTGNNYLSLRAKAEEGHAKYESRTKAVMDALQGLQSKIRKIEADRSNAEINLKCLALETKDYKELLKQKQDLGGSMDVTLKDSQSKELESQLVHAQDRCTVLEKQLETMRKVMKRQSLPKTVESVSEYRTPTKEAERLRTQSSTRKSTNESVMVDSSAIEKLNDLEKEHKRLTVTQSQTEDKISKLEEKIQKEVCHRKLLQDKTKQLQTDFGTKKKIDEVRGTVYEVQPTMPQQPLKRRKKRNESKSTISEATKVSISHSSDKPRTSTRSPSPSQHYLVDFSNIPFVVGQSTSKSHSLGANIQSVLSIMKSHNMLCCDASPKSCRSTHAKCKPKQSQLLGSCKHLHELLTTLQDEFAQLGFEHREMILQLESSSKTRSKTANLEQEKEKMMERMEAKGKQIHIIRDHLEKVQMAEKESRKRKSKKENVTVKGSDAVEVATTVRRSPEVKTNPKLDMYKKVKKIQSTLCKGDLKWL